MEKEKKSLWFKMLDKGKINQYVLSTFENYVDSNPFSLLSFYKPDNQMIYRLQEYRTWFGGSPEKLEKFYKQSKSPELGSFHRNGFYAKVNGDMPRVHFPLPEAISQAMSTLLFNSMPRITITGPNEKETLEYDNLVKEVLEENDWATLCQRGSQLESFSGALAGKFAVENGKVYIQFYSQDEFEVVKKFNKVKEIIFSDFIKRKKESFRLYTHVGCGYIKYSLYKVNESTGNEKEVSLKELDDTKDLKDIYIIDSTGKPVDILLAVYKENRPGSNEFIGANIGKSDYEGLTSIFDAADEAYSTLADYYRNGRIFTIVSESLLQKDAKGNISFNTWGINNIMRLTTTPEEAKENADRDVPDLNNVEKILSGLTRYIGAACQRVGLSPATLGMSDSISNVSAEALSIREYVSERTRNDKIKLWQEFLAKTAKLIIVYYLLGNLKGTQSKEGLVYKIDPADIDEIGVAVDFSPYSEETIDEKFNRLYPIYEKGFMTKEDLITRVYGAYVPAADLLKIKNDLLGLQSTSEN